MSTNDLVMKVEKLKELEELLEEIKTEAEEVRDEIKHEIFSSILAKNPRLLQNELSTKLMYSRDWLKRSEPQFPTALRHYLHSARYAQRPASSLTVRVYQHKIKLIWPKNIGALSEGTLVNGIWSSPER